MKTEVLAADTGPDHEGGVTCLDLASQPVNTKPIAGVQNWRKHHHKAFGLSKSLYDIDPETNKPVGEPIADAFAVVARENNALLAVADGCGWGVNSCLAARTAVKGCIEHLSDHLHKASTTQEIIEIMLKSLKHAHERIVDSKKGTITTLCTGVVCKIQGINCYGLCVVNVGDSLAFVYRKDGYVQEVTVGCHDPGERDMRHTGGCIGPLVGDDPDLGNLTCSFTFVEEGDIVFLTSDGITDNFDPNVLKIKSPSDIDHLLTPVKPSIAKSQESLLLDQSEEHGEVRNEEAPRVRSYSAPVDREAHNAAVSTDLSCEFMKKVRKLRRCSSKHSLGSKEPSSKKWTCDICSISLAQKVTLVLPYGIDCTVLTTSTPITLTTASLASFNVTFSTRFVCNTGLALINSTMLQELF